MRSLFAMYVLTPLTAMLLVLAFPAHQAVEIAVLLMAISAGAPPLPKKFLKLSVNPPYVYSLAIIASLLAIVSVPVARHRRRVRRQTRQRPGDRGGLHDRDGISCTAARRHVGPARLWPALAKRISDPIIGTANIILLGLILFIGATNFSAIFGAVDLSGFALIVVMTFAALAMAMFLEDPIRTIAPRWRSPVRLVFPPSYCSSPR